MRPSLLILGVATLFTAGTLLAQRPTQPGSKRAPFDPAFYAKALQTPPVPTVVIKGDAPTTQRLTYERLWRTDFYPLFETFNVHKVFLYEPGTNTLGIIRNNRTFDQTSGALVGGQVQIYWSTDMGASYTPTEVYNKLGTVFAMPNIGVANPGNSASSPADLDWTILGYTFDESVQWARTSSAGIFQTSGEPFDIPMEGPDVNNNQGFGWNTGDMVGVSGDNPGAFHAGTLRNAPNGQYGTYGTFGFDFNAEDFTTSQIPTAWDVNQFRNPGVLNSSYNGGVRLGADADGTLYMAVNNIYADDENLRTPGVSVSQDQGVTWSMFDRMPAAAYEAYRTSRSWDNIQVTGAYEMEALAVTGTGKFSYFFRVGQVQNSQWANIDIVEAKYDNGTWTLTQVAELNGFPASFTRNDEKSDAVGQYAYIPTYEENPQGHEIEVAVTADGKGMIVKWIDDNPDLGYTVFSPAQVIYFYSQAQSAYVEGTIDSMMTTDVYISYRQTSGSSWSAKGNLTNDMHYDHGTRIPPVIPSLQEVPFLSLKTITKSEYNTTYPYLPAIRNLPDLILDASVDYRTPNFVQYSLFDATNPNSVSEVESYTFRFETVSPNPATDEAQVVFTMDVPGNVHIELYSSVGSVVENVYNGTLDAGIHGMIVNTSNLASGAYYVSLTVNGKKVAQPLSVVK